jgi:hypothetical protein
LRDNVPELRAASRRLGWLEAVAQHAKGQEGDCDHAAMMFWFAAIRVK